MLVRQQKNTYLIGWDYTELNMTYGREQKYEDALRLGYLMNTVLKIVRLF